MCLNTYKRLEGIQPLKKGFKPTPYQAQEGRGRGEGGGPVDKVTLEIPRGKFLGNTPDMVTLSDFGRAHKITYVNSFQNCSSCNQIMKVGYRSVDFSGDGKVRCLSCYQKTPLVNGSVDQQVDRSIPRLCVGCGESIYWNQYLYLDREDKSWCSECDRPAPSKHEPCSCGHEDGGIYGDRPCLFDKPKDGSLFLKPDESYCICLRCERIGVRATKMQSGPNCHCNPSGDGTEMVSFKTFTILKTLIEPVKTIIGVDPAKTPDKSAAVVVEKEEDDRLEVLDVVCPSGKLTCHTCQAEITPLQSSTDYSPTAEDKIVYKCRTCYGRSKRPHDFKLRAEHKESILKALKKEQMEAQRQMTPNEIMERSLWHTRGLLGPGKIIWPAEIIEKRRELPILTPKALGLPPKHEYRQIPTPRQYASKASFLSDQKRFEYAHEMERCAICKVRYAVGYYGTFHERMKKYGTTCPAGNHKKYFANNTMARTEFVLSSSSLLKKASRRFLKWITSGKIVSEDNQKTLNQEIEKEGHCGGQEFFGKDL